MANLESSYPGINATSNMLRRFLLALRTGFQFEGARDLYKTFGYPRTISTELLYEKYARQGMAQTIVNKPAESLWTDPPQLDANKQFVRKWMDLGEATDLWSVLLRADKLLGMEQYVVLFLGSPGAPTEPLGSNAVIYIQVFGGSSAEVIDVIRDTTNPRFGMPSKYRLKYNITDGKGASFEAHWTRCIHLTNEVLTNNLLSDPRLLRGYNDLEDLQKTTGGASETFWLTGNRGMQVDVDKDMELDAASEAALSAEIEEYEHQLRRTMRTRGVKVNPLGSEVADPRGVFLVLISNLSATYKIPQRILLGAEAGQLASEQDRANWAVSVQERRASFAEPCFLLPIIRHLVGTRVLPAPNTLPKFVWPEAFKLSPLERAQTMAQTARAVVNLSRQAQYNFPLVNQEEARNICGFVGPLVDMTNLSPDPDNTDGGTAGTQEDDSQKPDKAE